MACDRAFGLAVCGTRRTLHPTEGRSSRRAAALRGRTLQGPDRTAARREWASTTDQTKIDSAGRLTLPKDWAEKVGLKTGAKALLVGAIDGFEIWAEDEFAADTNGTQARGRNLLADYD